MNRIAKIIAQSGFSGVRPTEEVLKRIGVNIKTWNKWVDNKKDPALDQLPAIAEFLKCEVEDLIEKKPHPASHVTG
uniref:helix-turn-helix transcriptional regulator n=1 Tax=Algoriphagus sp. TaxID=1872435 RepID=UPI00258CF936|nr:helix-turn-helix transcriptional regulator [Algoriphagus sp.]